MKEEFTLDILDGQYSESDKKSELDYWKPFSDLIIESINKRDQLSLSQTDLAKLMKTKQSVISRFENMGRLPSYDFVVRLSIALGYTPGMTLFGEYMSVVPLEMQTLVKHLADRENIDTKDFVQELMTDAIDKKYQQLSLNFLSTNEDSSAKEVGVNNKETEITKQTYVQTANSISSFGIAC